MADEVSASLCNIYRAYRRRVHHLALQERPAVVDEPEFAEERDAVLRQWRALLQA